MAGRGCGDAPACPSARRRRPCGPREPPRLRLGHLPLVEGVRFTPVPERHVRLGDILPRAGLRRPALAGTMSGEGRSSRGAIKMTAKRSHGAGGRGFVPLPRRPRHHGLMGRPSAPARGDSSRGAGPVRGPLVHRCRRPARDDERLPEALAGLHLVASPPPCSIERRTSRAGCDTGPHRGDSSASRPASHRPNGRRSNGSSALRAGTTPSRSTPIRPDCPCFGVRSRSAQRASRPRPPPPRGAAP